MEKNIKRLINKTVFEIISKASNKIPLITNKHYKKLHFIPLKYRVFGGLLQSMNIQFGNFIEILMKNLILNEEKYEIIEKFSGKKNNTFSLSAENEKLLMHIFQDANMIMMMFQFLILKLLIFF